MPEFVTLTCPSCGGKLNITPDVDRFACAHCGHEHVVKRGGGVISLTPVLDTIRTIGLGVDKTAAELALVRVDRELDQLQEHKQQVILSMPPPKKSNTPIVLIAIAIILVIGSIGDSNSTSSTRVLALLIAPVCALIGLVMLQVHSRAVRQWQATYQYAIASIDADIAKKEDEKADYLRIVRSQSPSNR